MIRMPLSLIGGVGLALVLFWLLALLVAPPEEEFEMLEMARPIEIIEAPDMPSEPSEPAPALETLPEPPVLAEPPPTPPDPAPLPQSELVLPEPEPEQEPEPEPQPEPEPKPEPEPEPEPQPEPEPEPEPEPQPEPKPVAPPQAEVEAEVPSDSAPAKSPDRAEISRADTQPRKGASQGPIDVGELLPINRVPPEYPRRAQRRGLEGYVELTFLVTPDGRVDTDSIRVVEARPGNVFDRAARQAVSQWRFEPSGQLRRARQRLEFQLR